MSQCLYWWVKAQKRKAGRCIYLAVFKHNKNLLCIHELTVSLSLVHVFHRAYHHSLGKALSALFCCTVYFLVVSLVNRYSGRYYTYRGSPGFIQCWSFQSQEYLSLYYRNQHIFDPKPTYSCHKYENLRPCKCKYLCRRLHIHWVRDLSLQNFLFFFS